MNNNLNLRTRLKMARQKMGLNQIETAAKIGMSLSFLRLIEMGYDERRIKPETIKTLEAFINTK